MNKFNILVVCVISTFLFSCGQKSPTKDIKNLKEMSTAEGSLNLFLKALETKDLDHISESLSPDGKAVFLNSDNKLIEGNKEILSYCKKWFNDVDYTIEAEVLEASINPLISHFNVDVTYRINREPKNFFHRRDFTVLMENENDMWYVAKGFAFSLNH